MRCIAAASAFLLDEDAEAEGVDRADASSPFFKRMVELVKPVEPLAVLCHGDCWTNNFMFRHDDNGHIEEVVATWTPHVHWLQRRVAVILSPPTPFRR